MREKPWKIVLEALMRGFHVATPRETFMMEDLQVFRMADAGIGARGSKVSIQDFLRTCVDLPEEYLREVEFALAKANWRDREDRQRKRCPTVEEARAEFAKYFPYGWEEEYLSEDQIIFRHEAGSADVKCALTPIFDMCDRPWSYLTAMGNKGHTSVDSCMRGFRRQLRQDSQVARYANRRLAAESIEAVLANDAGLRRDKAEEDQWSSQRVHGSPSPTGWIGACDCGSRHGKSCVGYDYDGRPSTSKD